jgi:hypothetical protein
MRLAHYVAAPILMFCGLAQAQQYNFDKLASDLFSIELKSSKIAV